MAKKKNETVEVATSQPMEQAPEPSVDAGAQSVGWETLLDHVQKQDQKVAELEGTLKELLTYLQKQQGAQMDPSQPQQQTGQSSLGMLGEIKGIIDTVRAQDKPLSMEARLAEMALTSMDLTNQYIRKRMIGEIENVSQQIQHTTVS